MPLPPGAVPPMQVPLGSNEQPAHQHQHPSTRAPYTYAQSTTGAAPLSIPSTADAALSVPRYVDTNPRPTKSPRHESHPSINSTASLSNNNDASSEYRYGSSYPPMNQSTSEIPPPAYGTETSSAAAHAGQSRDYYPPPSSSWTTSAGESTSTMAYANEARSYTSPGQYKSSLPPVPAKSEGAGSGAVYNGSQRGSFDTMNHYSWHAI